MKKILCIGIAAGLFMFGNNIIVSAENIKTNGSSIVEFKKEAVNIKNKEIKYENDYLICNVQIPVIEGLNNKEVEDKINKLFENEILNFKTELEKDAKNSREFSNKENIEFRKYEMYSKFKVSYNKNNLLSVTITNYEYTGGAHGMSFNKSYNIDLNTGNEAFLEDFFNKEEDYKSIIINNIEKQIKNDENKYFPEAIATVYKMSQDQEFYIEEGNIVVYFQQYDIAPYCYGIPQFKIPFSEFKKGVNLDISVKDPAVRLNKKHIVEFTEALNIDFKIPVIDGIKDKKVQEEVNKKLNYMFDEYKSEMEKGFSEYAADAKKFGWKTSPYVLDSDYFISYNHKNLLSLTSTVYTYTGGAHGNSINVSYNIDTNTGKELNLQSIFKENYDYKSVINKEIIRQMKESKDEYFVEKANDFDGISDKQSFYFEDNAIVVYFNQCEIASYAAGTLKYRIPFSIIKDGLNKEIYNNF